MTPRLIVSDLDGTLLGSDHRLHDSTIEVLRLVRQGHHLALASVATTTICASSAMSWACLLT